MTYTVAMKTTFPKNTVATPNIQKEKKTLTMGQKDNTNNSEYTDKMNEDDLC